MNKIILNNKEYKITDKECKLLEKKYEKENRKDVSEYFSLCNSLINPYNKKQMMGIDLRGFQMNTSYTEYNNLNHDYSNNVAYLDKTKWNDLNIGDFIFVNNIFYLIYDKCLNNINVISFSFYGLFDKYKFHKDELDKIEKVYFKRLN